MRKTKFGCDPDKEGIGPGGWIHERGKKDFDQNLALEVAKSLDLLLGMPVNVKRKQQHKRGYER